MERNMNEYSDEEILQCLKYAVYGEEMGAEIIKNSSETIFVIIGFIIAFASSAANIRIITMIGIAILAYGGGTIGTRIKKCREIAAQLLIGWEYEKIGMDTYNFYLAPKTMESPCFTIERAASGGWHYIRRDTAGISEDFWKLHRCIFSAQQEVLNVNPDRQSMYMSF